MLMPFYYVSESALDLVMAWYTSDKSNFPTQINTLGFEQNGPHFTDIFECNFLNLKIYILIKIFTEFCSWESN